MQVMQSCLFFLNLMWTNNMCPLAILIHTSILNLDAEPQLHVNGDIIQLEHLVWPQVDMFELQYQTRMIHADQ